MGFDYNEFGEARDNGLEKDEGDYANKYVCSHCGNRFSSRDYLKEHVRVIHG
jgi:hypothetical protein